MTEVPAAAVSSILAVVRTLPIWLLAGLALAGYAILYAPALGGVDPREFRSNWGVWIWAVALTFSILAVVRGIDAVVRCYLARRSVGDRRALRLIPLQRQCWWHLAMQRDESFISQIALDVEATNITDQPVRIVKARITRPRNRELVQSMVDLPREGSPYHSERHPVPLHGTATASVHLMVRGALAAKGKPIRVTIVLTDQFGDEYDLKKIRIPTRDQPDPKLPLKERLSACSKQLFQRKVPDDVTPAALEWQHNGKFAKVDSILNEERRIFAANGRERGGLGSFNVTLQSEPNFGWTEVGKIPALLWDKDKAKVVKSSNATRLLKQYQGLSAAGKGDLEQYLLSHLNKASPYADIAYFIFFCLHRMGHTLRAVENAKRSLRGDKVYGYSNVLGLLAALISHEHFAMDTNLFNSLPELLTDQADREFRLIEKINLASLRKLDAEQADSVSL